MEIITDSKGLVEEITALNDDGEVLLINADFKGQSVDEAVEKIMNLALESGYLIEGEENAIIITYESDSTKQSTGAQEKLIYTIDRFKKAKNINVQTGN